MHQSPKHIQRRILKAKYALSGYNYKYPAKEKYPQKLLEKNIPEKKF
jgi:hypothetical protein